MPKYRETTGTVPVTTWQRADSVTIENPYPGVPRLIFTEARVSQHGDKVTSERVGKLDETFSQTKAGEVFNLLDPTTGDIVRTMTYGEAMQAVYPILHSLYYHVAGKRDAGG